MTHKFCTHHLLRQCQIEDVEVTMVPPHRSVCASALLLAPNLTDIIDPITNRFK